MGLDHLAEGYSFIPGAGSHCRFLGREGSGGHRPGDYFPASVKRELSEQAGEAQPGGWRAKGELPGI